jgi:hypothetical protein
MPASNAIWFIDPRTTRLRVLPIPMGSMAAISAAATSALTPMRSSIHAISGNSRAGRVRYSRAGRITGSRVRSLTQRTKRARPIFKAFAYQSPSRLTGRASSDGGATGAGAAASEYNEAWPHRVRYLIRTEGASPAGR